MRRILRLCFLPTTCGLGEPDSYKARIYQALLTCRLILLFYIWPVAYSGTTLHLCYKSQLFTQQEVPGARVIWYEPYVIRL